jgi:hypothetical protein
MSVMADYVQPEAKKLFLYLNQFTHTSLELKTKSRYSRHRQMVKITGESFLPERAASFKLPALNAHAAKLYISEVEFGKLQRHSE